MDEIVVTDVLIHIILIYILALVNILSCIATVQFIVYSPFGTVVV